MRARNIHLVGFVAVAAVGLMGPAPVQAADTPTCMGRTATIVGTPYGDRLYGTPGDDVVWLGGTALEGRGYDHYDRFVGGDGDDLVCQGGLGPVSIDAGNGADEVHLDGALPGDQILGLDVSGGPGSDRLVAPPQDTAFLGGDAGDDVLVGGGGSDFLTGGEGDDQIRAGGGDDRVYEGPGSDDVDAGAGHDRLVYSENSNAQASEEFDDFVPGPVTVDVTAGTVLSGPDVDTVTENECWVGTSMADTMTGSDRADCLDGAFGAGEDTIVAGDGADLVAIAAGSVDAGPGDDVVTAEYPYVEPYDTRQDPIRTSITVDAGEGADHVFANGYRMTADGGPGPDLLDLSELSRHDGRREGWLIDLGAGSVSGSPRTFETTVELTSFEGLVGSDYDDVLRGSDGPDDFQGGDGDDRARSGRGRDLLQGGPGRDVLEGGQGDDVIRGQGGRPDLADGGRGHDRCSAERREECEAAA